MNGKRFLLMAAFGALATIVMPSAFAGTITNTITVKWNTQAISTLTVVTDYANTSGTATQGTGSPTIISNVNGGTGLCTAAGGGAEAAQVANFGAVTPDGTTKYTDCLYENGANAFVASTDSSGYSLAVAGALPASGVANPYLLCLLPNPAAGWSAPSAGGPTPVTVTTRSGNAPAVDNGGTNTCAAASGGKGVSLVAGTLQTSTGASGTTSGANYGGDIELAMPALANSGAQAVTITYTLTLN